MSTAKRQPAADLAHIWAGGGFAGAWRYEQQSARLQCDEDVATALGLAVEGPLTAFLAMVDEADRAALLAAVQATAHDGGRLDRRFRIGHGPAAGQWARLAGRASQGVLAAALTDLPGEGERMDSWRDAEQRFRHAFDQTPTTAVQGYDRLRRVIYWNAASEQLYGWRREEALGRLLEDLIVPPPMRADVVRLHTAWLEQGVAIPAGELELQHKDGSMVPVFSSHVMLRNGWDEPEMYCIDVDLRQQRQAMLEGHQRERQLSVLSQVSHAGWWEWELLTDEVRWSAELGRWFGVGPGQAARLDLLRRLDEATRQQLQAHWIHVQRGGALDLELRQLVAGQERHFLLHVEAPDPTVPQRRIGTLLDITESKAAASRIDRLARHDDMTGLPNRLQMSERLEEALSRQRRNPKGKLLVACLGLDRFRLVNESFGPSRGDSLLNACAERLRGRLRAHDLLARLGGDHFGVLIESVRDEAEAETLAQQLLGLFRQPFGSGEQEHYLSASLGLSCWPDDGSSAEVLLQHAETALHRAKEQGGGHHQFYRAEMNERALERVQMLNRLRRAQPQGELSLHYQAQRRLSDRSLMGAEALLRWHSPQLGNVPPDRFIPLAEESGLIDTEGGLGDWVLARCCETLAGWQGGPQAHLRLAANLSARQFRSGRLPGTVARLLQEHGVNPQRLELEVTESLLLDHDQATQRQLFALKDLGVALALDDFGTGYSSLAMLRRVPVDVLKIDRSFVKDLGHDGEADALVRAIVGMAKALKLQLVAEGVETEAQAAFLNALGCETGQGWLFGRPVPLDDF
ncbi:putative bifunctional diguanylate cyclase/phosphodiesterase [Inhella sp.]|uniref:putative bifunctional diguanylate cyclase/phosphodiesterase n=1 Tax=Inhella sp. TaxID=1921806 RepID=UPI0035B00F9A